MRKVARLNEELFALDVSQQQGVPILRDAIYHLLKGCVDKKDLAAGKRVQCIIFQCELQFVAVLGDHLIRLFAACGSLLEANLVFCKVSRPSIYTWNSIIAAHVTFGESERALELYDQMQEDGISADKVIFLFVLKACSSLGALTWARIAHEQIIRRGIVTDIVIQSALIDMYAKCGSVEEARKVFEAFANPDVVSWGTMMGAYAHHGHGLAALEFFEKMQHEGIKPDRVTFLCILKSIGGIVAIEQGRMIHDQIIKDGLDFDVVIGSTFVDMYAKCGRLKDAHKVFHELPHQNVVTWNTIISGYAQYGHGCLALELFRKMLQDGKQPEKVTFLCVLKACDNTRLTEQGKLIHDQIIRCRLDPDVMVGNTIVDMYAKWGSLGEARKVFDKLPNRQVVSWNAMIGGYTQQGQSHHALKLFQEMQTEGVMPDKITFSCILNSCGIMEALDQGKLIHEEIIGNGLEGDVAIGSALVDMYCKCGSLDKAHEVFDILPSRNLVSWNALIAGYAQYGHGHIALELLRRMQEERVMPDNITFSCVLKACNTIGFIHAGNMMHDIIIKGGCQLDAILGSTLVAMYAKWGWLKEAHKVFDGLPNRNVVVWAVMIAGYADHGRGDSALELFEKMQSEGIRPEKVTFLCVLKACGSIGGIEHGKPIHEQILRSGAESDLVIENTLIDMYAKTRNLDEARRMFDNMRTRDVVSWSAMISGYAHHGDGSAALELFGVMQKEGKQPEKTTFLCVLQACGSIGAIEHGKTIHEQIIRSGLDSDFTIENTLVDMYAKSGRLKEACKVFDELSNRDIVSWNAMVSGYAQHGNYRLAKICLQNMQQQGLKPDVKTYTSILAACCHRGQVEEGICFFKSMDKEFGIRPSIEHFNCIIDALSRTGHLQGAKELLQTMPVLPDTTGWGSLLNACRTHGDMELGRICLDEIVQLDTDFAAGYMLMSNIYVDAHMLDDAVKLQELRMCVSAWKKPGNAWIEIQNKMHEFIVGVKDHPQSGDINLTSKRLEKHVKKKGYVPKLDLVLEPQLDEDYECSQNVT